MTSASLQSETDSACGWVVVAGTFMFLVLGFGAAYSFTAFFPALEAEFQASREDISLMFGIAGFLYFSWGAVSGALADKFGTRIVVLLGTALLGAGLIAGSYASSLSQAYLAFGLGIGIGIGFAYVPSVGAVQRWFVVRRGMAGGFAVAGIGVGTLIGPPIAAELIAYDGWRFAYLVLGVTVLTLGLAAATQIDDPPSHKQGRAGRLAAVR